MPLARASGIKAAAPPATSALLDRLASDDVQDAPLRCGVRSRKEPSRITTRSVVKSATIGKPLASPRPAVVMSLPSAQQTQATST